MFREIANDDDDDDDVDDGDDDDYVDGDDDDGDFGSEVGPAPFAIYSRSVLIWIYLVIRPLIWRHFIG